MYLDFNETEILNVLLEDNKDVNKSELKERINNFEIDTGNLVDDANLKTMAIQLVEKIDFMSEDQFNKMKNDVPLAEFVEY